MKRINCTLADIARKTGLSTATVSLALRNNPRISPPTRTLVKKAAQDMGYRPDPLLSALVARRNKSQPHRTYSNLGVIIDESWSRLPDKGEWVDRVVKGMKESAHHLGYDLDVLYLRRDLDKVGAPDRFLEARGIRGLVLPSLFEARQYLTLNWNRYAIVVLGSHSTWPDFHRIATDFFAGMEALVSHLHTLGYRRIGMAHSYSMEKTHRFEWLGSYLKEAHRQPRRIRPLPPHLPEDLTEEGFFKWLKKTKPDCVVSNQRECLQWMQGRGMRIPEDMGFVFLFTTRPKERIAAMVTDYSLLGSVSIMQLHATLLRGESGIPKWQTETLICPKWLHGKTIHPLLGN